MTMFSERQALDDLEAMIGEKLERADLVAETARTLSALLDDEGMRLYFMTVDSFCSLDRSLAVFMVKSGEETLVSLKDSETRKEVLRRLLEMGRAKWSVVDRAYRKLSSITQYPDLVRGWLDTAGILADIDQDVALQYLEVCMPVIESIGERQFPLWASYGVQISRLSWKTAKEYFKSSAEVFKRIDACDLDRWARLGIYLIEKSPKIKAGYNAHSMLAAGASAGKSKKVDLALQYFKSAPQILARLSMNDLEEWVAKGLEATDVLKDRGTSYFSLQTGTSRSAVEGLVKGLELRDTHTVLRSYAEALAGKKLMLRSSSIFYKNLPGLSRFFSVTDGERIFLPSRIEVFADEELNFKTFKWILTHELGHLLHGTFTIGKKDLGCLTGLKNPNQAFKLFEFLEDERVDFLLGLSYPGLEKDRRIIMDAFLSQTHVKGEVKRSVFESLSFRMSDTMTDSGTLACRLTPLLKEALAEVLRPDCTVRNVLDLTVSLYTSLNGEASCEVCENRESMDRLFYRGIIDYDLVENTRAGTSRLVMDMVDRFNEKKVEMVPETVKLALSRLEEAEIIDSEELLWQVEDSERLAELFEQVQNVIAEMESEKRFRRSVYYDEWDLKLDDYRKDWCRVREIDMSETSPVFYRKIIEDNYGLVSLLRRYFSLLRPDRIQRFFREERGDDIDFDAAIEAVVERHAGITPSDRVYIRREKNLRDVSVAFLLDMSYSTGDELPSGKRIIDIEREGMVLMAEALESIGDQWAVYGFSSNYRDKVDFFVVQDFDEPFGIKAKSRFESIRPIAQTRLGAAIRHANRLLARRPSRIRLLILLSDGRPYDIDYGDADYAVEDTRRALWEGRRKGVNSFCITVDKKSRDYLPYMYGEANYTLIDNIETLPARLPLIYKRLTT
jgi:nitric oxide reductase NorD protein